MLILKDTSDAELVWLFQNCKFAIYPATYEGWGLPHAEALAFGKVSLTSNSSSLPEVAGDLVGYFNPYDPSDCLATIRKYLDPATLAAAEARIAREYKTTSWRDSYRAIQSSGCSLPCRTARQSYSATPTSAAEPEHTGVGDGKYSAAKSE